MSNQLMNPDFAHHFVALLSCILKDPSQARLCYCFDLKLNVTKPLNSSTGKNINCSLKLKFLRLFLILVPVKGLSIIFSAFWRLFKKLELKECLCS